MIIIDNIVITILHARVFSLMLNIAQSLVGVSSKRALLALLLKGRFL